MLCYGIVWANRQTANDVCTGIRIDILNADSTTFVTKKGILKELQTLGYNPVGKKLTEINTDQMERDLGGYEYLEDVECVILNDKSLHIKVRQMIPVMRIFDGEDSYYINIKGKKMHASAKYFNDVPVVEGHFSHKYSPLSLLPIIQYVEKDPELSALVTMYSVRDSNNIFIVPCIHGHVVNFGKPENVENKFAKLLKFYREVLPLKGWMTYDTISLKWDYQVVGSRRHKLTKLEEEYDPNDDEQAPDLGTILVDAKMKSDPGSNDSAPQPSPSKAKKEEPTKKSSDKKKNEEVKKAPEEKAARNSADKVKNAFKKN